MFGRKTSCVKTIAINMKAFTLLWVTVCMLIAPGGSTFGDEFVHIKVLVPSSTHEHHTHIVHDSELAPAPVPAHKVIHHYHYRPRRRPLKKKHHKVIESLVLNDLQHSISNEHLELLNHAGDIAGQIIEPPSETYVVHEEYQRPQETYIVHEEQQRPQETYIVQEEREQPKSYASTFDISDISEPVSAHYVEHGSDGHLLKYRKPEVETYRIKEVKKQTHSPPDYETDSHTTDQVGYLYETKHAADPYKHIEPHSSLFGYSKTKTKTKPSAAGYRYQSIQQTESADGYHYKQPQFHYEAVEDHLYDQHYDVSKYQGQGSYRQSYPKIANAGTQLKRPSPHYQQASDDESVLVPLPFVPPSDHRVHSPQFHYKSEELIDLPTTEDSRERHQGGNSYNAGHVQGVDRFNYPPPYL